MQGHVFLLCTGAHNGLNPALSIVCYRYICCCLENKLIFFPNVLCHGNASIGHALTASLRFVLKLFKSIELQDGRPVLEDWFSGPRSHLFCDIKSLTSD